MAMPSRAVLVNGVLFQAAWFACVLGGANNVIWPGVGVVLLLIVSLANAPTLRHDAQLALLLVPTGWVLDSAWIATGVLDYHGASVAPAWIVLMWLALGLTINHSMAFFRDRPWLGSLAVLGAAPLSYFAGERLGAVIVPEPARLIIVALVWAVLFFCVFSFARVRSKRWLAAGATG